MISPRLSASWVRSNIGTCPGRHEGKAEDGPRAKAWGLLIVINHDILIALVRWYSEGGRQMLKRAYIEITNVCNLNCSFCPGTKRKKKYMSVDEFRAIAAKLRGYTEYIYLHVMGEPLLHPQLEEILDAATELGFRINITTNGTLLSAKSDLLRKYASIRKVSVSLHSYEGNHMPGEADDSLEQYLEDVWRFASQAACIVALRLWNEGGANERNRAIIDFLSRKTGLDVEGIPDTPNGRRLSDTCAELPGPDRNGYNSRIYLESASKFTWPTEQPDEQPVTFCHGLTQQVAVLCDGTVVPCCLDGEGTIALGNLLESEPGDIFTSDRAEKLIQGFIDHSPSEELCRHCDYATRFA